MGTIIRLCDWFGITTLVCSEETVDRYNPKVVQATMGSLARVNLIYTNLHAYLSETNLPIYGTFMDGTSIYETQLSQKGIIVMGNEANGISKEVEDTITERIAIPRFGNLQLTESLNVATATAIILSEFRRR
jgi:TrmH family RNA methyltransferase